MQRPVLLKHDTISFELLNSENSMSVLQIDFYCRFLNFIAVHIIPSVSWQGIQHGMFSRARFKMLKLHSTRLSSGRMAHFV
jgi:hypothetical protein